MTAVRLHGVEVTLGGATVIGGIDLDVDAGEWIALIGPNGAGKTTLLKAVAGLVPYRGSVRLDGVEVRDASRRRLSRLVAVVPQQPELPMGMTVTDYVLLGRTPHIPYLGVETAEDLAVVAEVLDRLALRELARRPLRTLSGGEVQRAVLARALAQDAPVLLLDEPTSALDVGHQQQVLELVDGLRRERGLTVLSAMHDLTAAGQFADRLVLMSQGRVAASGPAREVLTERAIADSYAAQVRVLELSDGTIVVVPVRSPDRRTHTVPGG